MEKINIAELLKDCPKGMELYSPIYGLGILTRVTDRIYVKFPKEHNEKCFKHDGKVSEDGEIMLFPKGKTTWEGFKRPFNDGDIIFTHANCLKVGLGNTWISIFQEKRNGGVATYVDMTEDGKDYYDYIDGDKGLLCMNEDIMCQRLATEEEKEKLFDAIKANGYKWNAETKTLEKLVKPKFKVGDRIKHETHISQEDVITEIKGAYYILNDESALPFTFQDEWELVPNKFDITTLKPFDKVLIRDNNAQKWFISFFGHYNNGLKRYKYCCVNDSRYAQCIPYEGNERLFDTTDDCDEYFKTW